MSSIRILFEVQNVRYKKREGKLTLTNNGIIWQPSNSAMDTVSVDLPYSEIKQQRVSPDTRPKVTLQVTMYPNREHVGLNYVFHFASQNSGGANANREEINFSIKKSKEDRNRLKELLSEQLPLHRSKTKEKLEDKIKFLQDNDELYTMYKDLVISKVITADEFWKLDLVQTLVDNRNSNLLGLGVKLHSFFI